MRGVTALVLACLLAAVAGSPAERIVGGSVANISQYPFAVVVQFLVSNNWMQQCGGAIINNRSYLSAAHCFPRSRPANQVRARVGTSLAHSGGTVHNTATIINHPSYSDWTLDNDISVVRVSAAFAFGTNVRAGSIAGANYNLADNQAVWVIGWGLTSWGGSASEQLRQVQLVTVNQNQCRNIHSILTANMLCAGWPAGGRDACTQDSGGPLLHNGVTVGVVSFGRECARPNSPGVYARVSRYASWITQNS